MRAMTIDRQQNEINVLLNLGGFNSFVCIVLSCWRNELLISFLSISYVVQWKSELKKKDMTFCGQMSTRLAAP